MFKDNNEILLISADMNSENLHVSGIEIGMVDKGFTDDLNGNARDRLFTTYVTSTGAVVTIHRGPNWPNN